MNRLQPILPLFFVTSAAWLLALVGPAVPARAGVPGEVSAGGYRYVTAATQIGENSQKGLDALCPQGEPVVGGGVLSNASLEARVEINTNRPVDTDSDGKADDGWRAYLDNVNSDGASAAMGVRAICDMRAKPSDYRYVATQSTAAPEGTQTPVIVDCPKGEPVVSGGVLSSGFLNDEMHVNTSRPFDDGDDGKKTDDGWRSWVDNENVGTTGQAIMGFAVCDRRRPAAAYAYRKTTADSPDNDDAFAERKCRHSERVVGGGFAASGGYPDRMYATASWGVPSSSGGAPAVPDRWAAAVNNLSGGNPGQTVQAYVTCRT